MTCSIISVAERENRDVCKFAGIYTMKSSESCVKKERKKKREKRRKISVLYKTLLQVFGSIFSCEVVVSSVSILCFEIHV